VQLWDTATGRERGEPLTGHDGAAWNVTFSPEGDLLVTTGTDHTVQLWDLGWWQQPPADWAQKGCRVVNRNLSQAEWKQFAGKLQYKRTCPTLPAGEDAQKDAPPAQYSS
jgi:WD40 repeat protein